MQSHVHVVCSRCAEMGWKFICPENVGHIVLTHRTMEKHRPKGAQCPIVSNKQLVLEIHFIFCSSDQNPGVGRITLP